jgi:lysophospholipase L1-like esterase
MRTSIRTIGKNIALVLSSGLLVAATCDQPFGPTSTGSGATYKTFNAFGDSIAAGYWDGTFPGQIKSYVGYYADNAAQSQNWTVTYEGFTTSGETTPQINSRMKNNLSQLKESDIFTWDAGGNDFLDARGNYQSNCSVSGLDNALNTWRGNWDALLDTVDANVGLTASAAPFIRTMNTYYPNPDQDRARQCSGQRNQYEVMLPRLLAAGDYMCATAEARGWRCADTVAIMNCNEDSNGNPDFNCASKRYIQNLVDQGICPRNVTSSAFREPTIDPNCIAAHLDATGDWTAFHDPRSVVKGGQALNLIQNDYTHPNDEGHVRIGRAHHDTGYDDVLGPRNENNYALCIDYEDNDGDGLTDCQDSNCAAYCQ